MADFIPPEEYRVRLEVEMNQAIKKIEEFMITFLQLFNEDVVLNTPVDTGYLRGSWTASIGSANPQGGSPDPSGGTTVAAINLVAQDMTFGDQSYFLTNGAHYAGFVEYGTSRMAPRFFLRASVQRAPELARQAKAVLRRDT